MKIYKTKWFDRWADKQGLKDESLCIAVDEMMAGLYEADMGAGLFKKRIARAGQGKSGGFRTLVATKKEDRWIFVFGFPKSERDNIDKDEAQALKALATHLLSLSESGIENAKNRGELIGVNCHA